MCGPIPMMEDLKSQFEELGVARDSIKSEEFKLVP
jgi:ferredoxin-NADP reductase